jgi:hypothetical protein
LRRRNLMHSNGGIRGQPRDQVCMVVSARGVAKHDLAAV